MDESTDCAICFHNVYNVHEDGTRVPFPPFKNKEECDEIDILLNFIPTASVMYRNQLFTEFPDWFRSVKLADVSLHILNAQHGSLAYIDEFMAVHRKHAGGAWTGRTRVEKIEDSISTFLTFRPMLNPSQQAVLDVQIAKRRVRLVEAALAEEDFRGGLKMLWNSPCANLAHRRQLGPLVRGFKNSLRGKLRGA